jgi:hypothetical protein
MNRPTRYERALLEQLVAEKERRRRSGGDSRSQIPAYDVEVPVPDRPGAPVERPQAVIVHL